MYNRVSEWKAAHRGLEPCLPLLVLHTDPRVPAPIPGYTQKSRDLHSRSGPAGVAALLLLRPHNYFLFACQPFFPWQWPSVHSWVTPSDGLSPHSVLVCPLPKAAPVLGPKRCHSGGCRGSYPGHVEDHCVNTFLPRLRGLACLAESLKKFIRDFFLKSQMFCFVKFHILGQIRIWALQAAWGPTAQRKLSLSL